MEQALNSRQVGKKSANCASHPSNKYSVRRRNLSQQAARTLGIQAGCYWALPTMMNRDWKQRLLAGLNTQLFCEGWRGTGCEEIRKLINNQASCSWGLTPQQCLSCQGNWSLWRVNYTHSSMPSSSSATFMDGWWC